LLTTQYRDHEKLFTNRYNNETFGIISTPEPNEKTYNEKYLKDLLTNDNLPIEISDVIEKIMLAFKMAPKKCKKNIKFLYHGNADVLSEKTGEVTFNGMLPTTQSIRQANKFTFKTPCCIYVFCLDDNTEVPFIIENDILSTVYSSQKTILLPPNLKAVPVDVIPESHEVRPYNTTDKNHILNRVDNKTFIFLRLCP
jgi:hypothetical protein